VSGFVLVDLANVQILITIRSVDTGDMKTSLGFLIVQDALNLASCFHGFVWFRRSLFQNPVPDFFFEAS
jgi:hypothetical protein